MSRMIPIVLVLSASVPSKILAILSLSLMCAFVGTGPSTASLALLWPCRSSPLRNLVSVLRWLDEERQRLLRELVNGVGARFLCAAPLDLVVGRVFDLGAAVAFEHI